MKTHIRYPSINQFRSVIKDVQHTVRYSGKDESGEPIFNNDRLPIVTMFGTVKLHGTNAGVCFNPEDGLWAESHARNLTIESDNFGFAAFVERNKEQFLEMHNSVRKYLVVPKDSTSVVYGEWVGQGIQTGVAISKIPRSFFIFGLLVKGKEYESWYSVDSLITFPEQNIYKITDYKTFHLVCDFEQPQLIQNDLVRITEEVEKECPVAKAFGHSGVGEGVVWSFHYNGKYFSFKVKGKEHSVSKVKTLAEVDVEKLQNVAEYVDYVVTEQRFKQIFTEVFETKEKFTYNKIGDFMKAFSADVFKEETDSLVENGLCAKDVGSPISSKVKKMLFDYVEKV